MARNDRSNSASRSAQQNPQELAAAREEWDNAFNDSSENDATRVLSTHGSYTAPEDGDNRTEVIERPYSDVPKAQKPHQSQEQTQVFNSVSVDSDPTEDFSPINYRAYAEPETQQVSATQPPHQDRPTAFEGNPDAGVPLELAEPTAAERYSRIQFFPALLSWFALYTLLAFSHYALQGIGDVFNITKYPTFPQGFSTAIDSLSQPAQGTSPWIWVGIDATLTLISAMFAGYAVARMARFAPAKQALGLWLWHIIMVLLATIATFTGFISTGSEEPRLALQTQLADAPLENSLGVLTLLALILIGALLGALFGPRYHKNVARLDNR